MALARYWLHNGHLTADSEKMSKSLGNVVSVQELLEEHPGEVIRLALLSSHYRQPLDFTNTGLDQAKQTLNKIYGALRLVPEMPIENRTAEQSPAQAVFEALEDDLNTPLAVTRLHEFVSTLNKMPAGSEQTELAVAIRDACSVMGILTTATGSVVQTRLVQ